MEASNYCDLAEAAAGTSGREAAAAALFSALCHRAEAAGCLGEVLSLPLAPAEEAAVAAVLRARAEAGAPSGELWPALYLSRGRLAEAADAHRQLSRADATRGGPGVGLSREMAVRKAAAAGQRAERMGGALAKLLPPAQRALVVAKGGGEQGPEAPLALADAAQQAGDALGQEMNAALVPSWRLVSVAQGAAGRIAVSCFLSVSLPG